MFNMEFDKRLLPGARVKPTDSFALGKQRVESSLRWLNQVWMGFEVLNRADIRQMVDDSLWRLHDQL